MTKAIQTKTNSKGVRYALTTNGQTFGVHVLRENYAAHRRGGLSQTWRYVEKDMTREAAEKLFNRRAGA